MRAMKVIIVNQIVVGVKVFWSRGRTKSLWKTNFRLNLAPKMFISELIRRLGNSDLRNAVPADDSSSSPISRSKLFLLLTRTSSELKLSPYESSPAVARNICPIVTKPRLGLLSFRNARFPKRRPLISVDSETVIV